MVKEIKAFKLLIDYFRDDNIVLWERAGWNLGKRLL